MSQENLHLFLTLLCSALLGRREAMSQSGVEFYGARVNGILATGLTLGVITREHCRRLETLAAYAGAHRTRELLSSLPPYGRWPMAKREVAA